MSGLLDERPDESMKADQQIAGFRSVSSHQSTNPLIHQSSSLPSTMQALQMRGLGELVMTTLPVPTPGPRDVLIRTLAATICTSDLHDLARNPFAIALPRVLGHEAAGVVASCGAEVREFTPGMRVAAHPVVPCGGCAECARGFGHLCARLGHLGHDRNGSFAEFFV